MAEIRYGFGINQSYTSLKTILSERLIIQRQF